MLRGYFDGGGLRKQNGHWQSGRVGVIPPPPTPVAMLTEGILYISGGNRIVTDGGILNHLNMSTPYSVVSHNGKPHFYPYDVGRGWEVDPYDPAINIAGSVFGSQWSDIRPYTHDMDIFKYANTVINYSFEKYFQNDDPEVIAYNNYIAEHGSARMHIRFKPNPDDPAYMQELERNLCLGKIGEPVSSYCAMPDAIYHGVSSTFCRFYIEGDIDVDEAHVLGSPEPVLLNATNGANITPNHTPIEYLHGFKVGNALELVGTNARENPTTQGLSVNVWRGYFSFPFDYENDASAPYLSLKVEVFYD